MNEETTTAKGSPNLDPITKAPGAHPVGVGLGAAAGGIAAGAAAGTLAAGPVGTIVGAAVGAVAGGLGGKAVAERIDPTVETQYWRENHAQQSYAGGWSFDEYEPAYRTGWEGRSEDSDRSFEDAESDLAKRYESSRGSSTLGWTDAKPAVRAAWDRTGTML
jgi:phage tail tape-measure protein